MYILSNQCTEQLVYFTPVLRSANMYLNTNTKYDSHKVQQPMNKL